MEARSARAAVRVFEADDVVLAEVAARLHLDDLERHLARVREAVHLPQRDVRALVLGEQRDLVAVGDLGGPAYDNPVFGSVVMLLALALASVGSTLTNVPAELADEAHWMLILLGFNLAIGLPLNVFPCLLDGLGRFPAKTAIRTAGLLLRTVFFLVVLWNQGGLIALAWAITAWDESSARASPRSRTRPR